MGLRYWFLLGVFVGPLAFAQNKFFAFGRHFTPDGKEISMKVDISPEGRSLTVLINRSEFGPFIGEIYRLNLAQANDNLTENLPFRVDRPTLDFVRPHIIAVTYNQSVQRESLLVVRNGVLTSLTMPEEVYFAKNVNVHVFPLALQDREAILVVMSDSSTRQIHGYLFNGSEPYRVQGLAIRGLDITSVQFHKDSVLINGQRHPIEKVPRGDYLRINSQGVMKNNGQASMRSLPPSQRLPRPDPGDPTVRIPPSLKPDTLPQQTPSEPPPKSGPLPALPPPSGEPQATEVKKPEVNQKAYNPDVLFNLPEVKKLKVESAAANSNVVPLVQFLKEKFEVIRDVPVMAQDYEYFSKELRLGMTGLLMRQTGGVRITGKPGTGKSHFTRVFLSYLMNQSENPEFRNRIYLRLNTADLVAGTKWVGNFESKISAVKTLAKVVPVIMVVEEMHSLVGAGTHSNNPNDIFQMLKEELADGRIKIIGNLTPVEWERYFSGDSAIGRRFPINIQIGEAKLEELIPIGRNFLKDKYSGAVEAPEETLRGIARIANRFDPISSNPGKFIQLLDFLAANAQAGGSAVITAEKLLENASLLYNYDLRELTPDKITERIRGLHSSLDERMVGQQAAKQMVARSLADHFLHQVESENTKPTSMILYGERGAGKTLLAQSIAEGLKFGYHRMMMSEFASDGHADEFKKRLGLALKANPFQVILFDEIEKAHRSVQFVLLRVLDQGVFEANLSTMRQHEGTVSEVDASKAILVAATNAAKEIANRPAEYASFSTAAERDGLDRYVLDRIPTYVPVESPNAEVVRGILQKFLREHIASFDRSGIRITLDENQIIEHLLAKIKPQIQAGRGGLGFTKPANAESAEGLPMDLSVRLLERQLLELRQDISMAIISEQAGRAVTVTIDAQGKLQVTPDAGATILAFTQRERDVATGRVRCGGAHLAL